MKTCTECNDTLDLDQFYVRRASPDGRTSSCKRCVKARQATYRTPGTPDRPARLTDAQLLDQVPDLTARVYRHVAAGEPGDCWLWTSATDTGGYGIVTVHHHAYRAHRLTWMLDQHTPVPDGLYVDHTCRVKSCVNPVHLRAVTPRVNALENSVGITAINAAKTHCKRGHPFDHANTYRPNGGGRACRACMAFYGREVIAHHPRLAPMVRTRTRHTDSDQVDS